MDAKFFEVLEYGALRELLAGRAQTALGRARLLQLEPLVDRERILEALKQTSECVKFLTEHAGFGLSGLPDPREACRLLRIEHIALEPKQILDLIRLMETGESLRLMFAGIEAEYPHLMKLVNQLPNLQALLKKVRGKILPDGELDDNASAELREIRQHIQQVRHRLYRRLQSILRQSPDEYIQEDVITIRNDRFVIPVRVEHKGQVAGVIHAASSSGATVFIEPLETIELNNELVQYREREQAEIERILLAMSDDLRAELESLERACEIITQLDVAAARARLAIDFQCCEPTLTEGYTLRLIEARHILLEHGLRQRGERVVPISLCFDDEHPVMIVSGPNAGGKTVALKTLGLSVLMAQSGLHVPAKEAALPIFHHVLPDIGDHQSIAANLSTFTAHIRTICEIAETLMPPALVLLDEVGTGTDPDEGAALAVAIVDDFKRRGAMVMATTHYQSLKMYAQMTPGVMSASVEFDEEKLQPTYRLLQGVAGSSSGIEIARRVGLPDSMIEEARRRRPTHEHDVAHYLRALKAELDAQRAARAALEEERRAVVETRRALESDYARREAERHRTFETRLQQILDDYNQQARTLLSQVHERRVQLSLQRTVDRQAARLKTELRKRAQAGLGQQLDSAPRLAEQPTDLPIGATVRLIDLNKTGIVTAVQGDAVTVEVGAMRIKTQRDNLEVVTLPDARASAEISRASSTMSVELKPRASVPNELNVIGCTVDEALERADKFLDDAYLASLDVVRIIHGAGTGALRTALRTQLAAHPHVARVRPGDERTHEAGAVTIVELQRD
ncbi:MAG: endonuclease MutS2 [Acidobacteriota bacterium]|nr:endonuclease MutS2 [Blastocatellia bacterium]MDW8239127.1 endonuclease MutS2 [Acidobacteriota bacterium]